MASREWERQQKVGTGCQAEPCSCQLYPSFIEAFLEALGADMKQENIVGCWCNLPAEIGRQNKHNPLTSVVMYLDQLAIRNPMRRAWDQFVCPVPLPTPEEDEILAYVKGHMVDMGPHFPLVHFTLNGEAGEHLGYAWGLNF